MRTKKFFSFAWRVILMAALVMPIVSIPGGASIANGPDAVEPTYQEYVGEPEVVEYKYLDQAPVLSVDQIARLQAAEEMINRPGPDLPIADAPIEGPVPGTETGATRSSRPDPSAPLANGDFTIFRNVNISSVLPSGSRSNVSEVSVDGAGKNIFATGNWWAARSTTGGSTWSYINPYSDMSDFCCDQIVMYDKARNLLIWLRMSDLVSGTVNRYRINASTNGGSSWFIWNLYSPTGNWYDYPHWAITNDYLYLATNLFSNGSGAWSSTRVLRISLDALRDGASLSISYHANTTQFNATPTQGASDIMYWGTHSSTTSLIIRGWAEDSNSVSVWTRTVPAWTSTSRGQAYCGNSDNWGGRTDHRILAGWVAKGVIGFMWNVQEGSGFTYPYVNAATFDEATKNYLARPYAFNSSYCILYPSMSVNSRGHLGLVLNYGSIPSIWASMDDDYNGAPPGWQVVTVASGSFRPTDDKWGDYNTSRPMHPADVVWQGSGHTLNTSGSCCNAAPRYFVFGRERDRLSWTYWRDK
jgi:hypothetical protein